MNETTRTELGFVVGLVIAVISIVMGAPVTVLAFGGVTGTESDAVTTFFRATGANTSAPDHPHSLLSVTT